MTQAQRITAAKAAHASGNYMLRRSDEGRSNNGEFQWKPLGKWTEAPYWDDCRKCGGGLHGNHPTRGWAYWTSMEDLDFCEIDPEHVVKLGDKLKVRRARVLLRNDLSAMNGMSVGGYMDLNGCTGITALPDNLSVGGDLYLNGCTKQLKYDADQRGLRWYV
jgi:hypothetical protein